MSHKDHPTTYVSRQTLPALSISTEFEAAQQLLRHYQEGREGFVEGMAVVTEHRTLPDFATKFGVSNEEPHFADVGYDHKHDRERIYSTDAQADAQNCPIIERPALGQVCR